MRTLPSSTWKAAWERKRHQLSRNKIIWPVSSRRAAAGTIALATRTNPINHLRSRVHLYLLIASSCSNRFRSARAGKFQNQTLCSVASFAVVTWLEPSAATSKTASTCGWLVMPRLTRKGSTTGPGSSLVLLAFPKVSSALSPSKI